jgi:hypothetical protein
MARARSSIKGAQSLRRLLRQLPDAARAELGDSLTAIGGRLLGRAKAEAPVRSGVLRAALSVKVAVRTLQLRLGLVTKAAKRKAYYGYFLDAGRKAQTVRARRRTASGVSTYQMKIKAIPASMYDFVFGRGRDLRRTELPKLRATLDRILSRAAVGAGDD